MALIPGTLPNGTKYPNDPQSLLDTFASYLTAPESKKNRATVTAVVPTAGATVSFNAGGQDETLLLNHTADLTSGTLTITLPSNATSVVGQVVRVFAREAVTTVSVTATSQTIRGAALTTLADNGTAAWQKVEASVWIRIQ
jgi:hypothetical protein